MRILWITLNFDEYARSGHSFRHFYYALEEYMKEIADVTFSGRRGVEYDIQKLVDESDPDFVMFFTNIFNNVDKLKNIDKVTVPKGVMCSDPWRRLLDHTKWINQHDIDTVFLYHGASQPEYQRRVKARCLRMFSSVDDKLFTNMNLERTQDVFLTGNLVLPSYPLRNAIYQTYRNKPNCWVKAEYKSIPTLNGYITKMNQHKVVATGNAWLPLVDRDDYAFFQVKSLETMATNTLLAMDTPTCAEELHLIPDENFVEITLKTFRKKISYYLKNEEERKAIAKRGHETFLKYHTSAQRAKWMLEEMERTITLQ